ncbi:hypothetical protein SAMN05660748_0989 [Blastococcus aggregatus]|uniref:Capsular polysaccharide biosynthesis protein n=1 Tax=Blastococcus aggregatus TaxID=38502 RepID=A0A285V0Y9_9ACTN|nr:hypothetical protein [Blastococcus aggregatus]SOC47732.1 hypothetical protein SAMN05660748_0989 [Blastococcus aggregatus]
MSEDSAPAVGGLPGVRLVLRRSWWVALGLAVGLGAGAGVGAVRPPVFESTAVLTVSAGDGVTSGDASRAAQALARLATEPGVVRDPLRAAGLPDAAANPRRSVRAQAAPDAPILTITGAASEASTARDLAATVSEALADLEPYPPFTATVVADAELPPGPRTPTWVEAAGGAGLGTALALVLAATIPGRRTASRSRADDQAAAEAEPDPDLLRY